MRRFPRGGRAFGRMFGLLFLLRHPVFILIVVVVLAAVYLYRRRR